MISEAHKILKEKFGYNSFRPFQKEIIENILGGNDTLAVMPTGGGKSLCYQVPALLSEKLSVVISPLISLMKDQVEQLNELGIGAIFLNSTLSWEEYSMNTDIVRRGKTKLLYVAPETLVLGKTIELLKEAGVSHIIVDEAHCISEWGHDFRPVYRKIKEVRRDFPEAVCAAFTATATKKVQDDIENSLGFEKSKRFVASFNRKNLYLEVREKITPEQQAIRFLKKYPDQSGIIYCATRKQVDKLYERLFEEGFSVRPYHAGLKEEERRENQELFIRDDIKIIVATIAFGMGINKSNVRFVVHYDLPKNLESYYQEIGRSGRDGLRAHCMLLYGEKDINKIEYFIEQSETAAERKKGRRHLEKMLSFTETFGCRRKVLLEYFGEKANFENCGMCDNCNESEKHMDDITIPAQKFLSCLIRAGEKQEKSHIIDILTGKNTEAIKTAGHNKLSTYGIGKNYSTEQWTALSSQFRRSGIISEHEGILTVSSEGKEFLKKRNLLMGKVPIEKVKKEKPIKTGFENYDSDLFEKLRELRKTIAKKANLPPYIVFNDKTLTEMATFYPRSKQEMLKINGVNVIKYERYGDVFINAIDAHCDKNNIKPAAAKPDKKRIAIGRSVYQEIGDAFNEGKSLSALMNETKYKRSRLLKHLVTYVENGFNISRDIVAEESRLNENQLEEVKKLFKEYGADSDKAVFNALGGRVHMDEISIVRIGMLNENLK